MSVSSVTTLGQQGAQNPTGYDAFREMDLNDFIKLMVAELQNQDPLNPMDNAQILQQMSQIREIGSNDRLTETLESAFLAQNVSTAGGMLGKWVAKLSDDGLVDMFGKVERVSVQEGVPLLHVGDQTVNLKNTTELQLLSESAGEDLNQYMELVGKTVEAATDQTPQVPSQVVTGRVHQVSFVDGAARLHIGEHTAALGNVIRVLDADS